MRYAYITKFAPTSSRLPRIRIELRPESKVLVRDADSLSRIWYVLGIEAFEDLNAALADARQRRDAKIRFLQGQIRHLQKMEFTP